MAKTYKAIKAHYWWPNMQKGIEKYIKKCDSCQQNKAKRSGPQGLLQPLPPPSKNWEEITMDFLTKLPETSKGYTAIFIVVCRMSKRVHFISTRNDADAPKTAMLFMWKIFCLHRLPKKIISDRDGKFISLFWQELFNLLGTKLSMSSARHPKTDGQTEHTIQTLENYLHHYIKYNQKDWDDKLFLAEFAYDNAVQDTIKMTPFQADGQDPKVPSIFLAYQLGDSGNDKVDTFLAGHISNINKCCQWLHKLGIGKTAPTPNKSTLVEEHNQQAILEAQKCMERYTNQGHKPVTFQVGDRVLISTKVFEELSSFTSRSNRALSAKYISLYTIIKQVTPVSFRVRLPAHITLVPTFHASLLAPYHEPNYELGYFTGHIPKLQNTPITAILDRKYSNGTVQYLAKWNNGDTHWVPGRNLEDAHPLILVWEDSLTA
jgi:hypothetical protein